MLKLNKQSGRILSVALVGVISLALCFPSHSVAEDPAAPHQDGVTERAIIKKRSPSPPGGPVPIPYPNSSGVDEAQHEDPAAQGEGSRSDAQVTERGLLPAAPTAPRSLLISNVRLWGSQEPSQSRCFRVMQNLHYGELVYGDRDDVYMNPPPIISGATYIRPCIGPAEGGTGGYPRYALTPATTNPFLSFTVNQQATVYVALPQYVPQPAWLNTFSDTGQLVSILTANTNRRTLKLFGKNYAAGPVVLGGNGASNTALGIYSVMVIPGWNPKLPAPATAAPSFTQPLTR